jgi:transposase InsO family protein
MDTKRFARFTSPGHAVTGDRSRSGAQRRERVGYELAHSIVDDHSRLQSDNAWTYTKNRALAELLEREGISHRTIPPRTPKRNGKVERYQQTLKREWGLGQRYRSSEHRAKALPHWLRHYNHDRRHSSIGNRPPISRVRKVSGQNS